jgi:hypothetical protein
MGESVVKLRVYRILERLRKELVRKHEGVEERTSKQRPPPITFIHEFKNEKV